MTGRVVRIGAALGVSGAATRLVRRALSAQPPGGAPRWTRTNHRGEPVSLLEGPALATGTALAVAAVPGLPARVRAAGVLAAVGAGGFGLLDDLAERGSAKGLRGHLGALHRGEVTTGLLKIAGIGVTGVVAAALASRPGAGDRARFGRGVDLAASAALVAGTANLVNLFDLRPGRALKVVLLHVPVLVRPGPEAMLTAVAIGASTAVLGEDLDERTMLGDCGANALGAVLGTAAVAGLERRGRLASLAVVLALVLASERVSFTKVIAATPGLRELDALGRRPR